METFTIEDLQHDREKAESLTIDLAINLEALNTGYHFNLEHYQKVKQAREKLNPKL